MLLGAALAQTAADPGLRAAAPGGNIIGGLSNRESSLWNQGRDFFVAPFMVQQNNLFIGLGPGFNLDSCGGCHSQPAIGGSSRSANPQAGSLALRGTLNRVPAFIRSNGPVRVARIKRDTANYQAGDVINLFTIAGRSDAAGCNLPQPDFDSLMAAGNLAFRIPTPLFGLGLIESIPDSTILANLAANAADSQALGIAGRPNRNSPDGGITRFGWKAQSPSLLLFAAEALNVEIGVTNDLFPRKRSAAPGCIFNTLPEDTLLPIGLANSPLPTVLPITQQFQFFMRFLAPPTAVASPDADAGKALFAQVGCALCHTPALTTADGVHPALSKQIVNLYSDLLLHHMGTVLADDIVQGNAAGDEFRTAPLWGLGQRVFFLHDGRTSDLQEAIRAHAGPPTPIPAGRRPAHVSYPASEANAVVARYLALSESQKQQLLIFLRSL